MPPDTYLVEVLHFLNPHLIWIEVIDPSIAREDKIVFEQIGIYGVLPVELTLDVVDEALKTRVSDEWLPASFVTIKKALAEAKEVWFCPKYFDRGSSIFEDNIHKYGELFVKRHGKKLKALSKILIKAGIASYDMCLFHQQLGLGKLKTKLKNFDSQAVIKEIEHYHEKKKVSKKNWEKSVKEQTMVTQATQELESALTTINLQKHNDVMLQLLQNKRNDFELCKDVDEKPVGKGYRRKQENMSREIITKETLTTWNSVEPNLNATMLKKKLELMTKNNNSLKKDNESKNDPKQILESTKKFLELNASKNLEGKEIQEIINKSNREQSSEINNYNIQKYNKEDKINTVSKLTKSSTKQYSACKEKRVVYGPPGILPTRLGMKVMVDNVEEEKLICYDNQEKSVEKEDIFANIDSGLNVEITNKNFLMNIHQNIEMSHKYVDPVTRSLNSKDHGIADDNNSSESTVKSSSKVLQKKLLLYENKKTTKLNSSMTSCSETSNKDSSSSSEEIKAKKIENRKQIQDSDDGDDEEVIRKINEEYSTPNKENC